MPQLVDRHAEQGELRALADTDSPKLALLYGRRRVGKTFLLTHCWEPAQAFFFTASAVTPKQNRRRLVEEIAAWTGEDHRPEDYPTWRTVFRLLVSMRGEGNLVIILDEFQYLGQDDEDLREVTSELNAVWEGPGRPQHPVLLVLSGSAVRTMEALAEGSAPLYGRLAWKAELEPFDYFDAAQMAPFESLRDRAYTYGIFGGMPRYLEPIDVEQSLAQNASRLMLSPRGEVRSQVETALLQERGLRDTQKYLGVLRAIGSGRTELNEIADHAGLDKHTTVRSIAEQLVELDYITRSRNFDAGRTTAWRYRLSDPAFRFYHNFVTRFESALETSSARAIWHAHVEPQLDTYMGHLFEDLVEQAYYRIGSRNGLEHIDTWGRWEGTDRARRSLEMDIVSRLASGGMLTGAIKWNRSPVGIEVHRDHMRDLDRIADAGRRWAHEAMEAGSELLYVAAGGFEDGFRQRAEEDGLPVRMWSLEELYEGP